MRSNVTAILVVRHGGEKLDETIAALRAQSVAPDRTLVAVAGPDELAQHMLTQGFDAVIQVNPAASFGAAVQAAVDGSELLDRSGGEWLWLLPEDAAPEPGALAHLILRVQATGTAAVAGPKLVDWDDPERIIELSQGLTWAGARWVLDRQELDQQQYDHYEDVLGVGPVGMLVRRDVWHRLGGFDPALPVYDDGLDFSVRARLAGYRVIVAPEARLRYARTGVAGPEINHRGSVLRRAHRLARTAQLHRRLSYAPPIIAPVMWLALPLIGLLGMVWALIRERPGTMLGELRAALTVFVHPGRILHARRRIRAQSTAGWGAVRPLRTDRKSVKSVRAVRREAVLSAQGRQQEELHFVQTGGLALTIGALFVGVGVTWWLVGASFVTGGGAGQLTQSLPELWRSTVGVAAVNVQSLGSFVHAVPADPFSWVLALLGSLTCWNPSLAIVLLMMAAVPAAALGGWMWASRLTQHIAGRLLGGISWGAVPVTFGALTSGRVTTLVLIIALPWVFFAASRAPRSWSWAGVTSFGVAVALAAAPSLIPAALLVLVAAVIMHARAVAKLLATTLVPLALFAPKLLSALATRQPLEFFADPGVPQQYVPATMGELLLGFPSAGLTELSDLLTGVGLTAVDPWILAACLLAPLGILVAVAVGTGPVRETVVLALIGLAGLATAMLSPHLAFVAQGAELVPVWAGSGATLYALSMVSLAVIGTRAFARAQLPAAIVAMACVVLIAVPGMVKVATKDIAVQADTQPIPAVMGAELMSDPATRALFLTPLGETEMRARLVDADSLTLDRIRTTQLVAREGAHERALADLVASLTSVGGGSLAEALSDAHIKFVLLADSPGSGGAELRSLLQEAFDQNDVLAPAGSTSHGLLWRVHAEGSVDDSAEATPGLSFDADDVVTTQRRPVSGTMLWWAQITVIALMFLLALPTGEVRERPQKRRAKRGARVFRSWKDRVTHGATPPADEREDTAPTEGERDTEPTEREHDTQHGETDRAEPGDTGHDVTDHTDEIAVITEAPDEETIYVGTTPLSAERDPETPAAAEPSAAEASAPDEEEHARESAEEDEATGSVREESDRHE